MKAQLKVAEETAGKAATKRAEVTLLAVHSGQTPGDLWKE